MSATGIPPYSHSQLLWASLQGKSIFCFATIHLDGLLTWLLDFRVLRFQELHAFSLQPSKPLKAPIYTHK